MSTSRAASRPSRPTGTGRPLTRAIPRPAAEISRVNTSISSGSTPCSSSSRTASSPEGVAKTASHRAIGAPWRTASGPTRLPRVALKASTRIDLPAPVSPVSTVKGASKPSTQCSTIAKSSILSSRSMGLLKPSRENRIEVQPWPQPHETGSVAAGRHLHPTTHVERTLGLPVDRQHRLAVAPKLKADGGRSGNQQRASNVQMRRHRREQQVFGLRIEDGTAGGERVGGRSGRRRHQHTVGGMRRIFEAVDVDAHANGPRAGASRKGHLVEGQVTVALAVLLPSGFEHRARFDPEVTLKHAGQSLIHERGRQLGQEAHVTQVDAEDGNLTGRHFPSHSQNGAVTPQGDGQIATGSVATQSLQLEGRAADGIDTV